MSNKRLITISTLAVINGLVLWVIEPQMAAFLSGCCVGLAYALGERNAKK